MITKQITKGNIDFLSIYIDALMIRLTHELSDVDKQKVLADLQDIQNVKTKFVGLMDIGQVVDTPKKNILNGDETAHLPVDNSWTAVAMQEFLNGYGRYGLDAISSVSDASFFSISLATRFKANRLFYRGEAQYGYKLQSKVERSIPVGANTEPGLSVEEVKQLKRFQADVRANSELSDELSQNGKLPDDDDPRWLPLMQHYDQSFGTRLLDISTSIFTGLYFASVAWDGLIDDSTDGVLYCFFVGNGGLTHRGRYYDAQPDDYDEVMDDLAPNSVYDSFGDWEYPDIFRLYKSSATSDRELAQDGWFLVKGLLVDGYGFGQGFKFRIPAERKVEIAKELWLTGYTPERMVRGPAGREAADKLAERLGISR